MRLLAGKLPAALLGDLLSRLPPSDERVVVGPGVGRDAAVIDFGGRMLVAKTDPVTFATEDAGWYAVNVNANDIACMGARPAWFLATALLPPGADEDLARALFAQVTSACASLGVELVGGHTEVTLGLDRPIICGAMLGEAEPDSVVTGDSVRPGDVILLTKGIALEGTALLAREAAPALARRGVAESVLADARALLYEPGISIVREARILCEVTKPRLLHDPTEGGLATALQEIATRTATTLRIRPDAVRVFDETAAVCAALELNPLGLLASGALLAIVAEEAVVAAIAALEDAGIDCWPIGTVEAGPGRVIIGAGHPLPSFARDELALFFDAAAPSHSRDDLPEGTDRE